MTTQVAHLVHTRFQHRNRRLTCGVTLAAATFVAVVLILATTASANATSPCDGLSTVVVTATGSGTTSGSSVAPSANCDFSVEVTPPASGGASGAAGATGATAPESCIVTTTPRALGTDGAEVEIRTNGHCVGVQIATRVNVGPPVPRSGGTVDRPQGSNDDENPSAAASQPAAPSTTGRSHRQALAKISGAKSLTCRCSCTTPRRTGATPAA